MVDETVTLSLKTYNELIEFKNKILDGYTYRTFKNRNGIFCGYDLVSKDDTLKIITKDNEYLNNIIEEQAEKIKDYNTNYDINNLKRMSLWEFFKWRRKYGMYR